jgi:hypothetical protein
VDEASGLVSPLEDDLAVFALGMVQRALLAAGQQLMAYEALVALVHTELFAALVHVVRQPSLGLINGANQVGFAGCASRQQACHPGPWPSADAAHLFFPC